MAIQQGHSNIMVWNHWVSSGLAGVVLFWIGSKILSGNMRNEHFMIPSEDDAYIIEGLP
jgi:uncharacterized membrane protein